MASFALSFGENSVKNGAKLVNKNAAATSPSLLIRQPPGYYAVSIACEDTPYLLYLKANMFSNGTRGTVISNYQGPSPNLPLNMRYTAKLWRQVRRLTPPPAAPNSRTRFSLVNFVAKYGLVEVGRITFTV